LRRWTARAGQQFDSPGVQSVGVGAQERSRSGERLRDAGPGRAFERGKRLEAYPNSGE
jgi:hypothetical protein